MELFVLTGTDDYLRDEVLARIRSAVLASGFSDFNHQRIRCSRTTRVSALLDALAELPMMADRRLLEILEAQELPSEAAATLARHLADPSSHRGTVVALSLRPPSGRRRGPDPLTSAGQQAGLVVECALGEQERPRWVQRRLKSLGVKASSRAVSEILRRTGSDLRHLGSQLDKLALYAGPGASVDLEEVEAVVLRSAEVKTWELTSAIGGRDLPKAIATLEHLLAEGESPAQLLSYLNSYLRSLAEADALQGQLGSAAAVARAMGRKSEYQVRRTLEELRTWSEAELRTAFEMLLRADLRMKTGSDARLVMELLLIQLCARRGRGAPRRGR